MASVKVIEVPPVMPSKSYVLTLSEKEADALVALNGFIGGSPTASPRGVINDILIELTSATGKPYSSTEAYKVLRQPVDENKIYFDDYRQDE